MDDPSLNGAGGISNKSNLSRAQQFDYEKKRIIESCFSKREEDGSISESYITHLRVEEDAAYPSTPPPPNANPDAKKLRTIIVTVRRTGRVRMHKARENANGTFSIGKTWILDDLTAIQSYTGATSSDTGGKQQKLWAGNTGFTVTLGKSYYWKANSQKEKQFFIASLVKIYHKYTAGNLPKLIGFDQKETKQLVEVATSSRPQLSSTSSESTKIDLAQSPNRSPRRELASQVESGKDSRKRIPSSGMSSMNKTPTRTQGNSQNSVGELNTLSSPIRNQGSLSKLSSNQNQRLIGQTNDDPYLSPSPIENSDNSLNTYGRPQNFRKITDSQRSFASERNFDSPRSLKDNENNSLTTTTPYSLVEESRNMFTSNAIESREKLFGSVKSSTPPTLNSFGIQREENSRSWSADKIQPNEQNILPADFVSVSANHPTTDLIQQDESRLGIGPILKARAKADVSVILSGAANALNSLKPMVGGAADRFRDLKSKSLEESDGSTGNSRQESFRPSSNSSSLMTSSNIPDFKFSEENAENLTSRQKIFQLDRLNEDSVLAPVGNGLPLKSKARISKKIRPSNEKINKELAMLGVDLLVLGGRSSDLINLWEQFGWLGEEIQTKNVEGMKEDIEREICRIQVGGWLNRLEEEDERIKAIKLEFDKVIEECDEFDGLLTLYIAELGILSEDVAYIEAQSQGLQVQTANQKLLQAELQTLLQTISISPKEIESLRESSLESTRGLNGIEGSLVILFKAMLTIDPSMGISSPRPSEDGSLNSSKPGAYGNSEIGSMRVLQEKKDIYQSEITLFLRRLKQFLQIKFAAAFDQTRQTFEREKSSKLSRSSARAKLDPEKYDQARNLLWKYSPLMLFTREVDRSEWENLMKMYGQVLMPLYQEEFQEAISTSKRATKKPSSDEHDSLFTSQVEKQTEGLATTARKLTVMKSQNLAKSLLSQGADSSVKSSLDKNQGSEPFEVVEELLSKIAFVISIEQNFVVEFFHVTSLGIQDFPETVAAASPEDRRGVDIKRPRVMDPNRDLAMLVIQSMEEIFSFFPKFFQGLVDWSIQIDSLQIVGMIAALERKIPEFEETNQEYINRTFQKIHTQLIEFFSKFLDDQIRVIEETKVKIKKRKGVVNFIKTFPLFVNSLEKKLIGAEEIEIRTIVNKAYSSVNKAMFETLKFIARENPNVQITGSDQIEKEALNYEIMLMQNMHFYLTEVDPRTNLILEEWKQSISDEMNEHMNLYLNAVIRRPLGKLLNFLESIESMMLSRQPGEPVTKISGMPSHSKSAFKKVVSNYDVKEIRRGIEMLRKRVEKHFGDEHDSGTANGSDLVRTVIHNCEKYYENVEDRILTISRDVYEGDVATEWTRADISAAFRK